MVAVHGRDKARAVYVSSEMFLLRTALHGGVKIGRFPMFAYLQRRCRWKRPTSLLLRRGHIGPPGGSRGAARSVCPRMSAA